jgi:hypothetical protein
MPRGALELSLISFIVHSHNSSPSPRSKRKIRYSRIQRCWDPHNAQYILSQRLYSVSSSCHFQSAFKPQFSFSRPFKMTTARSTSWNMCKMVPKSFITNLPSKNCDSDEESPWTWIIEGKHEDSRKHRTQKWWMKLLPANSRSMNTQLCSWVRVISIHEDASIRKKVRHKLHTAKVYSTT